MPEDALLLTEADLRPLTQDPSLIEGAINALAQATLALHEAAVTQATFLGHPQSTGRPSARLTLATGVGLGTGARIFGTPAPDHLGLARPRNTRGYLLLDDETGQVLALMDFGRLNALRVGAVGGLVARHLAPPHARTLGILGSGQQARTQVQAICRALPALEQVLVYSPTPEHRTAFARDMAEWLGVPFRAVDSAEEAGRDADVLDLATSSTQPVIDHLHVKPGAVVISVTEGQVPVEVVDRARIVFTTWEAIAQNLIPREPYASRIKEGTFSRANLAAELTSVVAGTATPRRDPSDIVVFELTSLHVHDLAVARWAHAWARTSGVGTPFVLSEG
jgi:ornithine cyclodeaminase/alanine dehydrogenase-like protein (mu-crystallin family)